MAVVNLRRIWNQKKSEMQITQAQAAKQLGWTQGAFSQYLNNLTTLNPAAVIKLANFLGVDPLEIDPEINRHLPNLSKTEVRFAASDPETRIKDKLVYGDVTLPFFMVAMDEHIKNAPKLPLGTLLLCHEPKSKESTARGTDIPQLHFLIRRNNSTAFEFVSEFDCPPKAELKTKWVVHAFIIH